MGGASCGCGVVGGCIRGSRWADVVVVGVSVWVGGGGQQGRLFACRPNWAAARAPYTPRSQALPALHCLLQRGANSSAAPTLTNYFGCSPVPPPLQDTREMLRFLSNTPDTTGNMRRRVQGLNLMLALVEVGGCWAREHTHTRAFSLCRSLSFSATPRTGPGGTALLSLPRSHVCRLCLTHFSRIHRMGSACGSVSSFT